ncbi:hypothetical protein EYS42_05015 [Aquabacterium lacunae]|uniref:Amidase n=1 Tax=Aquabacterium lacunae TaxID=2528630 RepID=A0A4Q9H090_9BURK|nr:hypothetical protein [Aquabacterium lacunae]TBO32552.1 hypothetical protein EYS42_05015 [Aquabacterium lacunae]
MAELDQVLGAVLSSLAQARRMADEQTSAIAQYYQSSPLLKGMTVPRIRLPEVVVDVPLIIDEVQAARPPVFASPKELSTLAVDAAIQQAQQADVPVSAALREQISRSLLVSFEQVLQAGQAGKLAPDLLREQLAEATDKALMTPVRDTVDTRVAALNKASIAASSRKLRGAADLPAATTRAATAAGLNAGAAVQKDPLVIRAAVLTAAKEAIRLSAIKEPGRAATLKTSVLTSEIKERTNPDTVTRLKLVLREEGMEWQDVKRADGSSSVMLTPE